MTSLCERNCSQCILVSTCGGCSLCEASLCSKNCRECFALCLERPQAAAYLNSLEGPGFNIQKGNDVQHPFHIPILPDRFNKPPEYQIAPFIGVHAGNAFSRNGEKINDSYMKNGFAAALNIDPKTKGILEFYIKDRPLEGFWDKRKDIYQSLRELNFTSVIAPNYSVYEDAPRIDHLFNIKRSTIVYNELLDAGINAIPDVSWFNLQDLVRWCNEINKSNIKTISFSFQVVDVRLKTSNIWKNYILGFRYLCQNISQDVNIIIAGLVSPFRIFEVFRAANGRKIHVLNQSAFVQSRRGMLSENRQQDRSLSFDDLFSRNIIYFNRLYSEMNNGFTDGSENGGILGMVLGWSKEKLIEYYQDYQNDNKDLSLKYEIEKEKLDFTFNIVDRQIRKKKIKMPNQDKYCNRGNNKCQNHVAVEV